MEKSSYYSKNQLLSYNCLFNFVTGARGIGKTYQFKTWAISDFIRTGSTCWWIMRYQTEIDTVDPAINDSVYSAGTTIVDSSVKMGYCQSKAGSSTQSQLVFNIALPKEIANSVTGATINSGTSLVVRAGGSRIPSSGSAVLGTTASWAFSSVVLNKELGIVRVTIDMPKSAEAEQNAATLAGSISLTLN